MSIFWVSDADNTLWDTDAIFREAQIGLLTDVEETIGVIANFPDRLAYLRSIDQALASQDHRGLRYPTAMLISALASNLQGLSLPESLKQALRGASPLNQADTDSILAHFVEVLNQLPPLRAGVQDGLESLQAADAEVVVVTEGPKERIDETLRAHGLTSLVSSVLSAKKTTSLFQRLARLKPTAARWAIGDQLDRDVVPAALSGFRAIHFPGGFTPNWASMHKDVTVDYLVTDNYLSAVNLALDRI